MYILIDVNDEEIKIAKMLKTQDIKSLLMLCLIKTGKTQSEINSK